MRNKGNETSAMKKKQREKRKRKKDERRGEEQIGAKTIYVNAANRKPRLRT
jgi:hypothetical protein